MELAKVFHINFGKFFTADIYFRLSKHCSDYFVFGFFIYPWAIGMFPTFLSGQFIFWLFQFCLHIFFHQLFHKRFVLTFTLNLWSWFTFHHINGNNLRLVSCLGNIYVWKDTNFLFMPFLSINFVWVMIVQSFRATFVNMHTQTDNGIIAYGTRNI